MSELLPLREPTMIVGWGVFAGTATLAASQTTGSDVYAVLIALITAAGAVAAAWVASRYRRRDDITLTRDEYEDLQERADRKHHHGK